MATSSKVRNDSVLPQRTRVRVQREIINLLKNAPEGTKLIVDPETGLPPSLTEIVAEIEGPTGTPYAQKFFQLKLVLPADFPNSPPRGFFLTKIYHPNVDMSTGAICVNTLKRDWSSAVSMSHVLGVIRCLLIVPFPESSLNDEAGKLFMESYEEYARRAKLMANVHARSHSCADMAIGSGSESPLKNSKENEGENINLKIKSSSSSSSAVLKQFNSVERHGNDTAGGATKKAKSMKNSKGADKKGKKKSGLKRL